MTIESMSWGEFHAVLGIAMPKVKNRSAANVALDWAKNMSIPVYNPIESGWDYNSDNKNFIVKHPKSKAVGDVAIDD